MTSLKTDGTIRALKGLALAATAITILGASACRTEGSPAQTDATAAQGSGAPGAATVRTQPADPAAAIKAAGETEAVTKSKQQRMDRLSGEGLIFIPEVAAKNSEMQTEVMSGKKTMAQMTAEFNTWLDAYIASHPKEVAEARARHESRMKTQSGPTSAPATPPATPAAPPADTTKK